MKLPMLITVAVIACNNSLAYAESGEPSGSLKHVCCGEAEATACQTTPVNAVVVTIPWGQPFSLGEGERTSLMDGLEIVFESVNSEGRCPKDVDCIWEGNAEIGIRLFKQDHPATLLKLNTNRALETERTYLEYTVKLINLEPYPATSILQDLSYLATLTVTK